MNYLLVLLLSVLALTSTVSASNIKCEFCGFVVGYIESFVSKNTSETTIIQEVEKVCKFVPENLQTTCDTVVESYLPEILSYITQKVPASVICKKIGLCNSIAVPVKPTNVGGAVECAVCEFAVSNIEKYLSQNATEQQIIAFLDKDCNIFGGLSEMCQTLVGQYAPEIISKLVAKEPSSKVCGQVGLCQNSTSCGFKTVGDTGCTVCSFIVEEVEDIIKENQTESYIVTYLNDQCKLFILGPIIDICQSMVEQYAPEIINAILNSEDPTQICGDLGLCASSSSSPSSSSENSNSEDSQSSENSFSSGSATSGSISGSSGQMRITIQ